MLHWVFLLLLSSGGDSSAVSDLVAPEVSAEELADTPGEARRWLDETTVTAVFRADRDAPGPVSNLEAEQLARASHGQEPSFVLARSPSVTVHSDSGGSNGYSYFRLRGMDQTRVNMTLDGVPLNEPEDQGVYFSNTADFLGAVESVQLQRGVGTSAWGVASYAGSLHFESAALFTRPRRNAGFALGSYGAERLFAEYNRGGADGRGLFLRLSAVESDGYKERSAHSSHSAFFGTGWSKGSHLVRLVGFSGHQENQLAWIGVPRQIAETAPRTNGNSDEDDHFDQTLAMLQYSTDQGEGGTLNACFYANFLDGDYDFDFDNFLGLPSGGELYNYAFRSRFFGAFATFSKTLGSLNLQAGLHGNRYRRRHVGSERNLGRLYENTGFKDEIAGFLKMGLRSGRWLFSGDLQARTVDFEYQGSVPMERLQWSFLNPRLGVTFRIDENASVYYSVGRTGREPTRNDLFAGFDDLAADESGQPLLRDLPPEYVIDHELGIRFESERGSIAANLYLMRFEDEIVLNGELGPNGLALHRGVDRSTRTGLELETAWVIFGGLEASARAALSKNRIREQAVSFEPVLSPELVFEGELGYERGLFDGSLSLRHQGESWIDFANTATVPSFTVLDARLALQRGSRQVAAFLNNLTDKSYLSSGTLGADGTPLYFVQARRNAVIQVRWSH